MRIDSGIVEGDTISTFYDPMISKLIIHAPDRTLAIQKLASALEDYTVIGLPTNIKFLKRVLKNKTFREGEFDTNFIEEHEQTLLTPPKEVSMERLGTIALVKAWLENLRFRTKRDSEVQPWSLRDNFRLNHNPYKELTLVDDDGLERHFKVQYLDENTFNVFLVDDKGWLVPCVQDAEVHMSETVPNELVIRNDHHMYVVDYYMDPDTDQVTQLDYEGAPLKIKVKKTVLEKEGDGESGAIRDHVRSPMPGTVVKVFCKPGDKVEAGQPLASIESMKMEYIVKADRACTVSKIDVKEAEFVQMKQRLVSFESEE